MKCQTCGNELRPLVAAKGSRYEGSKLFRRCSRCGTPAPEPATTPAPPPAEEK